MFTLASAGTNRLEMRTKEANREPMLLERGERIIAASHARLTDQAEIAYTLELGTVSSADTVPAPESLPIQRALFVDAGQTAASPWCTEYSRTHRRLDPPNPNRRCSFPLH